MMENDKHLDEEFRQCVSDMKPHTKSLPYKSEERHRVTLWIKKLLALNSHKEERNAYARQLRQMLESGDLSEPFTTPPPLLGPPPLSPGKRSRGGETSLLGSHETHRRGGPQLAGMTGDHSSPLLLATDFHPPLTSSLLSGTSSVGVSHDQLGDSASVDFRPLSLCCSTESLHDQSDMVTLQATPTPHPLFQPPCVPSTGTSHRLTSDTLQQREMELLLRSSETQHKEEKLKLQREHEDTIQQLLRKRTKELEEVREKCKGQVEQLKTQNTHLGKRVTELQRELNEQRKDRGTSVRDSPLLSELRHQLQAEFDKKLYGTITDSERQKLEQERRHTKHVQQVVTDCGRRIDQMERDCASQISTSSAVVAEMEGRAQELTQQNSSIAAEKESLKEKVWSLEQKLQEAHERGIEWREKVSLLERERERERMEEKKSAETEMEARLREKEAEHSQEQARLLEKVCGLGLQLQQCQETNRETTETHRREMAEARKTMEQLRSSLRISEGRLGRMRVAQERQTQQAEVAIEEFKTQVEEQSSKVFSSLHGDLERLAAELAECWLERNRRTEEWADERREERQRISTQLQAMEACHKHEIEELKSQHNTQLNSQHKKLERAKEQEVSSQHQKISELQTQSKAAASRTAKTVSSLEEKVRQLQQEMEVQRSRHSRDTARLRRRIEEERQSAKKTREAAVSEVKEECQEDRKRVKMAHQREINSLKDKHNQMLQQLEHSSAEEAAKTAETVGSLQAQVQCLTSEITRQGNSFREQLAEVERAREQERASLTHHHDLMLQSVREEADASQQIVSQLQESLEKLQQEHMNKVSAMRLQLQASLAGMIPIAVKKEYDGMIQALRSQVVSLEQRRALLQNELEQLRPVLPPHHHRNITQTRPRFLPAALTE